MSSQSKYIPLTIRLMNEQYQEFHRLVTERGHTHVAVVRILIGKWVTEQKAEKPDKKKS